MISFVRLVFINVVFLLVLASAWMANLLPAEVLFGLGLILFVANILLIRRPNSWVGTESSAKKKRLILLILLYLVAVTLGIQRALERGWQLLDWLGILVVTMVVIFLLSRLTAKQNSSDNREQM